MRVVGDKLEAERLQRIAARDSLNQYVGGQLDAARQTMRDVDDRVTAAIERTLACELFVASSGVCGSTNDVRRFVMGRRCVAHRPAGYVEPPGCTYPLRCYCPTHVAKLTHAAENGHARKIKGQADALANAHEEWLNAAKRQIMYLASLPEPFTSEDVTRVVGLPRRRTASNQNNAVGALMTAAARRNIIRKVGRVTSAHGSEITQWRGADR